MNNLLELLPHEVPDLTHDFSSDCAPLPDAAQADDYEFTPADFEVLEKDLFNFDYNDEPSSCDATANMKEKLLVSFYHRAKVTYLHYLIQNRDSQEMYYAVMHLHNVALYLMVYTLKRMKTENMFIATETYVSLSIQHDATITPFLLALDSYPIL
jgi:hypothetical protein